MDDQVLSSDAIAFNGDKYLQVEIAKLIKKHNIRSVIETGTHAGCSTAAFTEMAHAVFSVELNIDLFDAAQERLRGKTNKLLSLGNSPDVLYDILSAIEGPHLFYLDASGKDYWPLLDELIVIYRFSHCRDCVIVMPGFYVPGSDFGYYTYKEQRLDFDYIKQKIYNINPNFQYYYNTQAEGGKRGCIFIHP
jgi:hypothetical protein